MGISVLGIIFNQVLLLILGRAWIGAIAASQMIARATIIDISNQQNKASLIGVISAADNLGFIVGPVLGGLLIDNTLVSWFGFTTPFYFATILALLSALLLLITYKETLKTQVQVEKKYNSPKVSKFLPVLWRTKIFAPFLLFMFAFKLDGQHICKPIFFR